MKQGNWEILKEVVCNKGYTQWLYTFPTNEEKYELFDN